jgi:hypothetical protein
LNVIQVLYSFVFIFSSRIPSMLCRSQISILPLHPLRTSGRTVHATSLLNLFHTSCATSRTLNTLDRCTAIPTFTIPPTNPNPAQDLQSPAPHLPQHPLHRQNRARPHRHHPHRPLHQPQPPHLLHHRLPPRNPRNAKTILSIPPNPLDHRVRPRQSRNPNVPHP